MLDHARTHAPSDPARRLTAGQIAQVAQLEDSDPSLVDKEISYLETDIYVSQERFDLEQRKLFRGRPLPITVSAALPAPRTHVVNEDYGVSILLTRDENSEVRAFLNVCAHRGVKLCQSKEAETGGLIVCPYHAWSFNLKGDLVGVPRAEVFPGLDKKMHGLVPLECVEAGGLIWVNLDRETKADFSLVTGELAQDFEAVKLPDQKIFRHVTVDLAANWKLVVDAFSENYHITRLHAESLKGMFVDRKTVCDRIGPHLRAMSGRAGFKQGGPVETFEEFRKSIVACYTILPGAVIITSPTYISVMLLAPQSPGRTIINYYMLVDRLPETEQELAHYERSFALMKRITTEEDFWVSELGQLGAQSGAMPRMILGGMEQDVARFHASLDAILEA